MKDILSIDDNSKVYENTGSNDTKSQTWTIIKENKTENIVICNEWYTNTKWVYIKKEDTSKNISLNNQTKKCYIDNWEWQQIYTDNTWWACEVVSCNTVYHKEWSSCISNKISCNIDNWDWYKTWDWSWSSCNISSCNNWYESKDWKCIKICSSYEHKEWDLCINNITSCDVENWIWEKEWVKWKWLPCRINSCNEWYDLTGKIISSEIYNNKTSILASDNKCEKIYINFKYINTKSNINSSSDVITNIYLDTNLISASVVNLCFTDNNNLLKSSYIFNLKWGWDLLGSVNVIDNKICFDNAYLSNYKEFQLFLVSGLTDEEKWKVYDMKIDKTILKIRNNNGWGIWPYYKQNFITWIEGINIIEE